MICKNVKNESLPFVLTEIPLNEIFFVLNFIRKPKFLLGSNWGFLWAS